MCNHCDSIAGKVVSKYNLRLDYATAKTLLRAIVAIKGEEYVYEKVEGRTVCLYVHTVDDKKVPGCIVGWVLFMAGMAVDDLPGSSSVSGNRPRFEEQGITFTDKALHLLQGAQGHQDRLNTWGRAVAQAVEAVDNRAHQYNADDESEKPMDEWLGQPLDEVEL